MKPAISLHLYHKNAKKTKNIQSWILSCTTPEELSQAIHIPPIKISGGKNIHTKAVKSEYRTTLPDKASKYQHPNFLSIFFSMHAIISSIDKPVISPNMLLAITLYNSISPCSHRSLSGG